MVLCSLPSLELLGPFQTPPVNDEAFMNEACDDGATVCVEQIGNLVNTLALI